MCIYYDFICLSLVIYSSTSLDVCALEKMRDCPLSLNWTMFWLGPQTYLVYFWMSKVRLQNPSTVYAEHLICTVHPHLRKRFPGRGLSFVTHSAVLGHAKESAFDNCWSTSRHCDEASNPSAYYPYASNVDREKSRIHIQIEKSNYVFCGSWLTCFGLVFTAFWLSSLGTFPHRLDSRSFFSFVFCAGQLVVEVTI